ncbi:MAG TPA: hypothetical protein VFS37_10635 [Conexibacter sp.]|nr:hypothetical protein [Conexibacter sp.]
MLRSAKKLPLLRLVALAQVGMLARRHLAALSPLERRRVLELGRRPHRLSRAEREELKRIAAKLEPRTFAENAFRTVSPIGGKRQRKRR